MSQPGEPSGPVTPSGANPRVSVLIPVFNGAPNLAECLDSILAQDFPDLEILVADDGSSDDSRSIIAQYAARDPRIRHWQNPQRLGLTANSNACLRAARGEYIKYVHQDDLLLSRSCLRKMVDALDRHPSAVLAGSQAHLTGSESRPVYFASQSGLYAGRPTILANLEANANLIGSPTLTLFRRSHASRGFDERFTSHMDLEMWFHLLEQGGFAYLAEPLATWRVHDHQQTAKIRSSGVVDQDHLLLIKTYYAKPWLREVATASLLFSQIYHLRKKYGHSADLLTAEMMTVLSPGRYALLWLKHKATRPLSKLARKWNRPARTVKSPT